MTTVVKVSNEEINAMVVEYQKAPTEELYSSIHEAVFPLAKILALKEYSNNYTFCHTNRLDKDDFIQCAYLAIYKAVPAYDINKAARTNFTMSVKTFVGWTIKDELYKKSSTQSAEFAAAAMSWEGITDAGTDISDILEANRVGFKLDSFEGVDDKLSGLDETEDALGSTLSLLVEDFKDTASADEYKIISNWVNTLINITDMTVDVKKAVNKALSAVYPDVASAALRKRKSRAEKKFNSFAVQNGYSSFVLSHY